MELIHTLHLFPKLDAALISLLKSLTPDEWKRPTLAREWTVKDVAAHLLDGNMRVISSRDNWPLNSNITINSYEDLVNYLNRLNASWVDAFKRISPQQIIELLERTGGRYYEGLLALDPHAPSIYAVDWAGERESQNWFHVAREFTEKWHHQQQIREAVNRPGIMSREFYFPVIDTFMRALPHAYRDAPAPDGLLVAVQVTGESGGQWFLRRVNQQWMQVMQATDKPTTEIHLDPTTAWQLFTNGITPADALKHTTIEGQADLGKPLLDMISVIAIRK